MFTTAHTLWLTLLTLTSLSTHVVLADRAITSPTAGATFQAGQSVEFRWYSDEEDDDRSRVNFDVALMSLTPLGEWSVRDQRVRETINLPMVVVPGSYYLAVNEHEDDDDDDNDRGIQAYDVRFRAQGETRTSPTMLNITSPSSLSSRAIINEPRRRIVPRQRGGFDGAVLSSPRSGSIPARSSFEFDYRCDDNDSERVAVGLIRAYTGLQGNARPSLADNGIWYEGNIVIPSDVAPGRYYLAVWADDDGSAAELREYELTFSTNAGLTSNNRVDIHGSQRSILIDVVSSSSGSASSWNSGALPSQTQSQSQSQPAASPGLGSGTPTGAQAVQSSIAAVVAQPISGARRETSSSLTIVVVTMTMVMMLVGCSA